MSLPETYISGGKRANLEMSDWIDDWFVGYGKDECCAFEGTWENMVQFARNILASENTKIVMPEFYHPEFSD